MRKTIIILVAVTLLGIVAAYEFPTRSNQTSSSTKSSATYKNGTYTGSTEANPYDTIRVTITVSGGRITSVNTPVLTGDTGHSDAINSYAVPQLNDQVVSSQSSQIDGVSGASFTKQSYVQSLQAAIDQAKA